MPRRLLRYSFIKFILLIVSLTLIVLYMSSWNTNYMSVVNQKFMNVENIIKGRFVDVVERDLKKEEVPKFDRFVDVRDRLEGQKKVIEVDEYDDDHSTTIKSNQKNKQLVEKARDLNERPPKPELSPEIKDLHRRLNLTNPGLLGAPVDLPEILDQDIELMLNKSLERYKIHEFVANLLPLDRELLDYRSPHCKKQTYSQNLPVASVIMVFHNEALSLILRTIYSILNRSPPHLIREIVLIDDCSDNGRPT